MQKMHKQTFSFLPLNSTPRTGPLNGVFAAALSALHVKTSAAESTFWSLDSGTRRPLGVLLGSVSAHLGNLNWSFVPGRRVQNVATAKWARWQMSLLFFFLLSFWNDGKGGRRAFPPGRREPRLPDAVDCLPVLYSPSLRRRDNLLQMTPCC